MWTCKKGVRWLYRLEENYTWESGFDVGEDRIFRDKKGKVRLIISAHGRIAVTRGYSWNGCSPKVCMFDLLLGTPDGVVHADTGRPKTYFASLVHDALYQFLRADSPLTRQQADKCFFRLMEASDFSLRYIYWAVVRVFGRMVRGGKSVKRKWAGTGVSITELLPLT